GAARSDRQRGDSTRVERRSPVERQYIRNAFWAGPKQCPDASGATGAGGAARFDLLEGCVRVQSCRKRYVRCGVRAICEIFLSGKARRAVSFHSRRRPQLVAILSEFTESAEGV